MFDIKPVVLQALDSIPGVTVSDAYPSDWAKLPHISFYEVANSDHLRLGQEVLTEVNIQVDVWHTQSTGAIAQQVDQALRNIGLRRAFSADIPDPSGVKHKTMRYRSLVNKRTNLVHQ